MMFVAYGAGMGLVLTGISLAVALGKTAVLRWVSRAGQALEYIGGLGLLVAASYLITYNLKGLQLMATGRQSALPLWMGVGSFLVALLASVVIIAWQRQQTAGAPRA